VRADRDDNADRNDDNADSSGPDADVHQEDEVSGRGKIRGGRGGGGMDEETNDEPPKIENPWGKSGQRAASRGARNDESEELQSASAWRGKGTRVRASEGAGKVLAAERDMDGDATQEEGGGMDKEAEEMEALEKDEQDSWKTQFDSARTTKKGRTVGARSTRASGRGAPPDLDNADAHNAHDDIDGMEQADAFAGAGASRSGAGPSGSDRGRAGGGKVGTRNRRVGGALPDGMYMGRPDGVPPAEDDSADEQSDQDDSHDAPTVDDNSDGAAVASDLPPRGARRNRGAAGAREGAARETARAGAG